MKYNETNLRSILQNISPTAYENYQYDNMNLPDIMRRIFEIGFVAFLEDKMKLRDIEKSILLKAYNTLNNTGKFNFEE